MAHGDKVGGVLGSHDAGDAGHGKDFALGDATLGDELEGLGFHIDKAPGYGLSLGVGLCADIDHPGPALLVQMAEALHIHPIPLLLEDTFNDGQGVAYSPAAMAEAVLFVGGKLGHGEGETLGEEYGIVAEASISTTFHSYCTFALTSGVFDGAGGQGKGYDANELGSAGPVRDTLEAFQKEIHVVIVGAGACVPSRADAGGAGKGIDLKAGIIGEGGEGRGAGEGDSLQGGVYFIGFAGLLDIKGYPKFGRGHQVELSVGEKLAQLMELARVGGGQEELARDNLLPRRGSSPPIS